MMVSYVVAFKKMVQKISTSTMMVGLVGMLLLPFLHPFL